MADSSPLTIRRVRPGEGARLRTVRLAALRDAPSAFGSTAAAEERLTDEQWDERAGAGARGADRVTFFAFDGELVVGLAGGFCDEPGSADVELVSMWIAPAARGRGAARLLVAAVCDWAVARGAARIGLWVTRGNEPARGLYERCGFVATGDHQPLPSDPCRDEWRMIRRLGPVGG